MVKRILGRNMNNKNLIKAFILAFLTFLLLNVVSCKNPFKPESRPPPIERYVPDDPQTMDSYRPSGGD